MKASKQTLSWAFFGRHAPLVIVAAVFGWLVGVTNLISDNHMVVSIIAPTLAGMSVLGVVTLAILVSFVSSPDLSSRVWRGADTQRYSEPSAVALDEPSHIHIPRRSKGENA